MSAKPSVESQSYRKEPRRRFTRDFKRRLVESLLDSPDSMARVARDNDLNQNQLAKWRRDQAGLFEGISGTSLVPVCIDDRAPVEVAAREARSRASVADGFLELVLPKGRVLIHATPDTNLLRSVIEAMQ